MKTAFVTGSSGFIGYHLCQKLLLDGYRVIGIDNLSDYYDVSLKKDRQGILLNNENFKVINASIEDPGVVLDVFKNERPDVVVHLAAQAGVRYSIENPRSYLESNIIGTFEVLEAARFYPPQHMLFASTSSVYGANTEMPYSETCKADHQVSFYAATKKSTEVMAHSYSHIYNLPITMFRFFTVYGPWGRPDMALFKFTKSIINGNPIDIYNNGEMWRDFTYIDDLVCGIRLLMDSVPDHKSEKSCFDSVSPVANWRVVNIGNSKTVNLNDFISEIEAKIGRQAVKNYMPMQSGDVHKTWADSKLLTGLTSYSPETDISAGIDKFVKWYREYYKV